VPISGAEFIVLIVVAAVVLGPERLPHYAQQLGRLVRELRRIAQGATETVRAELGPDFDDVDWRKLDPRQYDPRRIVREALSDAWDPDDPMGLKGAGLDRAGLERDVETLRRAGTGTSNGAAGSSAGGTGSKPVSAGGPSDQADTQVRPAFDEDAT
jgi:sec-independent protein translocase protein TatB